MTIEAKKEEIQSNHRLSNKRIQQILKGDKVFQVADEQSKGGMKLCGFEDFYEVLHPTHRELPSSMKYAAAIQLIEAGYHDVKKLVDNYIPKDYEPTPEDLELKERLNLLVTATLAQRGELDANSEEVRKVGSTFTKRLDSDETLQELVLGDVPPEIIGLIAVAEQFSDITDEQKIEELRSWVTAPTLRWYAGKLKGTAPKKGIPTIDIINRIPKNIFTNSESLKYTLVERYFEQVLKQQMTNIGFQDGLIQISRLLDETEDESKKVMIKSIQTRLTDMVSTPLKGDFKKKIVVKEQEYPFPSAEQLSFAYDFLHNNTRLVTADTGSGKTGAALLAMEQTDATKVLVIAPAMGRKTWQDQDSVLFKQPGQVFTIDGQDDLSLATKIDSKYLVISRELISRADRNPILAKKLYELVDGINIDAEIIDEIADFSNPDMQASTVAFELLNRIRENYKRRTGSSNAPVIGLTATPIKTSLADLNVPMAMLYPNEYVSTKGNETKEKKTFSDTYLGRPDLAYLSLFGQRKMTSWKSQPGVQEFSYNREILNLSPFEQLLYEFIGSEVDAGILEKMDWLESVQLNPFFVKGKVRRVIGDKIPAIDLDEASITLKKAIVGWQELKGIQIPDLGDDYLSVDKLVELGFDDLVLSCYFSDLLDNGVDTLVDLLTHNTSDPDLAALKTFWKPKKLSTKYQTLRDDMTQSLTWKLGEDGVLTRNKVLIVSPSRVQGRTGDFLGDRSLLTEWELTALNNSTLIKLIREEWVRDLCDPEDILVIDGKSAIGKRRDRLIERWIKDPNAAVLFVNLDAVYKSRDFAIETVIDEYQRKIGGIDQTFLNQTWYYEKFKQMVGRTLRTGQAVPTNTKVLIGKNTIDQGKDDRVLFTQLYTRILLTGVKLPQDQQEFFDSMLDKKHSIPLQNIDARFLNNVLNFVRGAGEDEVSRYLNAISNGSEITNDQKLAEAFFDGGNDEFKISGYNAELVASIINKFDIDHGKVLSLGAGTLLLQRKLQRGIDNLDLNRHMMQAGWELAKQYGGNIHLGRASTLDREIFADSTYDFVDNAFALHWSKYKANSAGESERVKILSEMNRVLKSGGTMVITVPEGSFDEEKFAKFTQEIESSFGFVINHELSGKSFGLSKVGSVKRLGWCIVAQKAGETNINAANLDNLAFLYDKTEWVSDSPKQKDNTVIQTIDSPSPLMKLHFNQYQIVNGGTTTTIFVDETFKTTGTTDKDNTNWEQQNDTIGTDNVTFIDIDSLRGTTREEYETFRSELIRPIMRATNLSWQEAEILALDTMQIIINRGRSPRNKLEAYLWVLKEIKRPFNGN